jgi:hypothetical protein
VPKVDIQIRALNEMFSSNSAKEKTIQSDKLVAPYCLKIMEHLITVLLVTTSLHITYGVI